MNYFFNGLGKYVGEVLIFFFDGYIDIFVKGFVGYMGINDFIIFVLFRIN